ncbi:centrosomal protein of 63 kDa [Ixodes scapularis]
MEREILFGDHLRLPEASFSSSCELELLRLLRDVDLAVLEKHQSWRSQLDDAAAARRRSEAELEQARRELRTSRDEIDQLRDHIGYLESAQADLVSKYEKRLADLRGDVLKIKKRYGELKTQPESQAMPDFWRVRASDLEKELVELRREAASLKGVNGDTDSRERELRRVIAEKDGVIDRLTETVTQLTKRVRHAEGVKSTPPDWGDKGCQMVDEFLDAFEGHREKNIEGLRRKIRGHVKEVTAKFEHDRKTM